MKFILLFFYVTSVFATASGPDYLQVSIEGKKHVLKNMGCNKKVCKVLFNGKELSFPISQTREAQGPISPTFDCSKTKYKAETLICENSTLANYDRHMAIVYKDAVRAIEKLDTDKSSELKRIKAMQRGWVKGRNDCWKESDIYSCVEHNYKYRISYLQAKWNLAAAAKKLRFSCDENKAEIYLSKFHTSYYDVISAEFGDKRYILVNDITDKLRYVGDGQFIVLTSDDQLLETGLEKCSNWKL